jgi:hypothetical protein
MSIQDLAAMIQTGHGLFKDDPQSGSILKLLGENGFKEKMESGAETGHTYTIIHNPPSTEFLLVDMWGEGENHRKAYHAFSIKTPPPARATPPSTSIETPPEPEHPLITMLKEMNADADKLLALI